MNLVLFEPAELDAPLPLADPRAQHILKVLRRAPGDRFVAGLVDGPLGRATFLGLCDDGSALRLAFSPEHEAPPPPPITLLVGLPRPQTARDLLRDATTLGVSCIHFVATERSDPNYAASTLWTSGEWRRQLLAGAAQACDTRLPQVTWTHPLASLLPRRCNPIGYTAENTPPATAAASATATTAVAQPAASTLLALDNYEATVSLAAALRPLRPSAPGTPPPPAPLTLAFGPERGWGPADRTALLAAGFTLCSLGTRVLRLETAVTAALAFAIFS